MEGRPVQDYFSSQEKMKKPSPAGMMCFYENRMHGECQSNVTKSQLVFPGRPPDSSPKAIKDCCIRRLR